MNDKWKRPFLTIAAGQTVSLIGSSAVQFALIWWLAVKTDSPMVLSLAGLVAFLPSFLLGPFAGVFIDRCKKKTVVIAADLAIGLLSGAFALYFQASDPPYWIVFVILGLRGVGGVFHAPAIQALIPRLVPGEELMKANGWSQFMQSGAFMLGPVIGGLLYGAFSMPVILLTDLLGAIIACATVFSVRVEGDTPAPRAPQSAFFREMKEGLTVFRDDAALRGILVATFLIMLFYMPLSSLYPLMTSSYFQLDAVYGSIVEFTYALGMLLIALVMAPLGKRFGKITLVYMGLLIIGVSTLACGVLPAAPILWFWVFAAACLCMGAGANFYNIPLMAYMQETIKPELMGRAFSLWSMVMSLAMPLGLLIAGPVAEKYGVAPWFFVSGVIVVVIAAIGYVLVRKRLPVK